MHEDKTRLGSHSPLSGSMVNFTETSSELRPHLPPLITADALANVTTALVMSLSLAAVAVAADISGYLIYSLIKQAEIKQQAITNFVFISGVGSAALGIFVLLPLIYYGILRRLADENNYCTRALIWAIVIVNFVVNTVLGFAEDRLFNHGQHNDLMQECFWSKLISLALVSSMGGIMLACVGEKYLGKQLTELYSAILLKAEESIGPGTAFHEAGGVRGKLFAAWGVLFPRAKKGSLTASEMDHPYSPLNEEEAPSV